MPGRPPKPTALKVLEGNRGKRALNAKEPEPDLAQNLEPPDHLSPEAMQVWREIAPELRKAKLFTELDRLSLEWLCVAAAQHRIATRNSGDDKLIMRNAETGAFSPSPWLIIQSMAFKRGKALCDAFGMTPAARSRVMIDPQGDLFGAGAQTDTNGPGRFFDQPTKH